MLSDLIQHLKLLNLAKYVNINLRNLRQSFGWLGPYDFSSRRQSARQNVRMYFEDLGVWIGASVPTKLIKEIEVV